MAKLIVQQGYFEREEIEITKPETIIGRDATCDLAIPDSEVSRRHVRISREDKGYCVEDLDSVNGTFLNQTPIRGKQELKHLDVLQISSNVFVFHDSSRPGDDPSTPRSTQQTYTLVYLRELAKRVEDNVKKVFKGDPVVVRNVLLCLLADGHVLIEDAPGLGKTILARAFAKSIQGTFRRIQFTPDLLPSDITGFSIYDEKKKEFRFMPGPVFGNVILADEINRTTPRTQSSLLECMAEAVVTFDGTPHVLPRPFFVIATQNSAEFHGTYPLPEAQLDRFLMRISIGYPENLVEKEILSSQAKTHPLNLITFVAKTMDLVQCQALVREVHVAEPVKDYIVRIATATRKHPALLIGVSPRASLALMRAGQALAAYSGRNYVLPSDIRELAQNVLSHRLLLKLRAQAAQDNPGEIIRELLNGIPLDDDQVPQT